MSSILVLKDGQIIERGSHSELLARDGVFAAMWADQILASGAPATSIVDQSVKEEVVSGYVVNQIEPEAAEVEVEPPHEHATSDAFVDTQETDPTAHISAENTDAPPVPAEEPAVAQPADESGPPVPVEFPTSDSTQLPSEVIPSQSGGGITFEDSANSPPSRTTTPDPEGETKRKRASSQNFQRFARKMSLATRRQGSAIIPGIKREGSSPQASQDGAGASSVRNSNDSPAGSVQSDTGKNKDKKDKKEKRKSIF